GRGVSYLATGDVDSALDDFNQALALDRDYADAWANRGLALETKGDKTKARAAYNRAMQISPGYKPAKEGIARIDAGKPPLRT
ncbi:MAG: tetratricopeptide repeat protein, partial [Pseudomonadota bacterium]